MRSNGTPHVSTIVIANNDAKTIVPNPEANFAHKLITVRGELRISVCPHDSRYSIATKGLTGFGYHRHVFHNNEIYMLPYFAHVHPEIAHTLSLNRYQLLPAARETAKGTEH